MEIKETARAYASQAFVFYGGICVVARQNVQQAIVFEITPYSDVIALFLNYVSVLVIY